MVGRGTIEAAKTVLEVAEVAFSAVEFGHHHGYHPEEKPTLVEEEVELESLRSENQRLRNLLEQNLKLFKNLSESPYLVEDCPPDLHDRLMETMESEKFLSQLESLHQKSVDGDCDFPFKEASDTDLESAEILINVDNKEPSWWVWVTDPKTQCSKEERSAIDNENYVIVSEQNVVDGVANFMARCVLSNPKALSLSPEEMQKTLVKAMQGMSKFDKMLNIWHAGNIFYLIATWGLALAGLYQTRAVLKVAAYGIHHTSKVVLKAL
jgi:hypothetical protein